MTTTERGLLTADDLLQLYGKGVRGELIRGCFAKLFRSDRNTAK